MSRELDWSSVTFIVPMEIDAERFVRVFCKHPTLTFDEWWLSRNARPQFVGVNEPPDGARRVACSGEHAKELADCFLETGTCPKDDPANSIQTSRNTGVESAPGDDDQESLFLEQIRAAPHDRALRLRYARWLTEKGDQRGRIIELGERAKAREISNAEERELHETVQALRDAISSDWIIAMRYWHDFERWKAPVIDIVRQRIVDHYTDQGCPMTVTDRPARVMRQRVAELDYQSMSNHSVFIEAAEKSTNRIDVAMIIIEDSQLQGTIHRFWADGVPFAVSETQRDLLRGMKIFYRDGAVHLDSDSSSGRKHKMSSMSHTLSVHSMQFSEEDAKLYLERLPGRIEALKNAVEQDPNQAQLLDLLEQMQQGTRKVHCPANAVRGDIGSTYDKGHTVDSWDADS